MIGTYYLLPTLPRPPHTEKTKTPAVLPNSPKLKKPNNSGKQHQRKAAGSGCGAHPMWSFSSTCQKTQLLWLLTCYRWDAAGPVNDVTINNFHWLVRLSRLGTCRQKEEFPIMGISTISSDMKLSYSSSSDWTPYVVTSQCHDCCKLQASLVCPQNQLWKHFQLFAFVTLQGNKSKQ
jgi:hypothetical protein